MKVLYVAGPFRASTAWGVHLNVTEAERWAFWVARLGAVPMCPHAMYRNYDGTKTGQFWLDATMELLKRCDAMAMIPGWQDSDGSCREYAHAREEAMPIFYLEDGESRERLASWAKMEGGII